MASGERLQYDSKNYYHYTNEKGLEGIMKTGYIKPSTDTTRDAVLGQGPYFTNLTPCNPKPKILKNNYDGAGARVDSRSGSRLSDRADYFVKIPRDQVPKAVVEDSGRSVFRGNPRGLNLKKMDGVTYGKHPGKK